MNENVNNELNQVEEQVTNEVVEQEEGLNINLNDKRVKVIFSSAIIGAFLICLGMSYALPGTGINSTSVNEETLNLVYGLTSSSLDKYSTVTIEGKKSISFVMTIDSDNKVDSYYKLYYELVKGNDVIVTISESDNFINKNSKKKVNIYVYNGNNTDSTIKFGIVGGLTNDIAVDKGIVLN